ncbi:MAG: endonuclease III domain-containing protein [Anaerolineae bacterium]
MTDDETLDARREKYNAIREKLADLYGYPRWRQHYPPVDELVLTILSQNTSDHNSIRGFKNLKDRYDTWEKVRDAPREDLIEAIRTAGLAKQKSGFIQNALNQITEEQGAITLDFLNEMPVDEAKDWLTGIKGIGPKTASIVLLFSLNKPAFPVDTHIHRVSRRLGLIGPKVNREKAHEILEAIAPAEDYYPLHLQLIQHGREICGASNPKCGICPLQDDCDWFNSLDPDARADKLAAATD